jgi:hypothetical protein
LTLHVLLLRQDIAIGKEGVLMGECANLEALVARFGRQCGALLDNPTARMDELRSGRAQAWPAP